MATLTAPAPFGRPSRVTWRLESNTQQFASPLTRSTQTLELAGARWACDIELPPMAQADWRTAHAFLVRMRGGAGRCYYGPPHYRWGGTDSWTADPSALTCDADTVTCDEDDVLVNQESRAPADLSLTVYGASQSGATIELTGWVGNAVVFRAGDYLSYDVPSGGRQLHMVPDDTYADAAGNVSVGIEPPIRRSPADGAAVETQTPTAIMRLADDLQAVLAVEAPLIGRVSVSLVEVF